MVLRAKSGLTAFSFDAKAEAVTMKPIFTKEEVSTPSSNASSIQSFSELMAKPRVMKRRCTIVAGAPL